jgi:hypothetical protein
VSGGLSPVKFADPTAASTSDKNSAHVLVCARFEHMEGEKKQKTVQEGSKGLVLIAAVY